MSLQPGRVGRLEAPGGARQRLLVRAHGANDLARNVHLARDEFRLLAHLHAAGLAAEACVTTGWLRRRLVGCGAAVEAMSFAGGKAAESLGIEFAYDGGKKFFRWSGNFATRHARFEADFGDGATELAAGASLLPPEVALSEAMFF